LNHERHQRQSRLASGQWRLRLPRKKGPRSSQALHGSWLTIPVCRQPNIRSGCLSWRSIARHGDGDAELAYPAADAYRHRHDTTPCDACRNAYADLQRAAV